MRICLYSGPSAGKSTLASYVFSHLKMRGLNIELISEYVKTWAYENRPLRGCDQFYIFAKQWRKEDIILRNGVEHLVTDSPLILQCAYAKKYGARGWKNILNMALEIEKDTPAINIFLSRVHGKYQNQGRYQTEKEALELDDYFKNFLTENSVNFDIIPNDGETILKHVVERIK